MSQAAARCCAPVLVFLAVGCGTTRNCLPPDVDVLVHRDPGNTIHQLEVSGIVAQVIDSSLPPAVTGHGSAATTRNILVLSGGGKYGAYSAGVLSGWSASGTRPTFDVVTGISTGALIAPLAFLGPRYDSFLEQSYTTVSTKDIYRRRPYLTVLFSDSLADPSPLRRRIGAQVTDEFLSEIAKAHAAGRRLYVGTTNLDTGRLVLWDLGAIASGNNPNKRALFQNVLLASCSIPGLLPPVPIEIEVDGSLYTELHVDGGVSAAMFLRPGMALRDAGVSATNVYVIAAGKLSFESQCVPRWLISVSSKALEEVLNAQTRDDLLRVFLLTRLIGGCFAVASVPQELMGNPDPARFEPVEMRRLFAVGYEQVVRGVAWHATPPGVNSKEWVWPRTGTQFNFQTNPSQTSSQH